MNAAGRMRTTLPVQRMADAYTKVWADTIVQLIQASVSGLITLSALRLRAMTMKAKPDPAALFTRSRFIA